MLLRKITSLECIERKTCLTNQSFSANIVFIPMSTLKFKELLNILLKLEAFTMVWRNFRFLSISVGNFCSYQKLLPLSPCRKALTTGCMLV